VRLVQLLGLADKLRSRVVT